MSSSYLLRACFCVPSPLAPKLQNNKTQEITTSFSLPSVCVCPYIFSFLPSFLRSFLHSFLRSFLSSTPILLRVTISPCLFVVLLFIVSFPSFFFVCLHSHCILLFLPALLSFVATVVVLLLLFYPPNPFLVSFLLLLVHKHPRKPRSHRFPLTALHKWPIGLPRHPIDRFTCYDLITPITNARTPWRLFLHATTL